MITMRCDDVYLFMKTKSEDEDDVRRKHKNDKRVRDK